MKIEIIESCSTDELQIAVNKFLASKPMNVHDIQFKHNPETADCYDGYYAMIVYKEEVLELPDYPRDL